MKSMAPIVLVGVMIIVLIRPLWRIPHRVYIDYNEGWVAYFSDMAINHQPLYQPLDATILNNYPPLSFYLIGALGQYTDDTIIAGRILSFGGFLLTTLMIALCIVRITRRMNISFLGSLAFAGYMCIYHGDYIGMNDPQWIALGLMMSGFTLVLYKSNEPMHLFISLGLMSVAGLIKHNLIALPLAISIWLYFRSRKLFFQWIGTGILGVCAILIILYALYGKDCLVDILLAPRVINISLIGRIGLWIIPLLLYLVAAVFLFATDKRPEIRLLFIAAIISFLWGTAMLSGSGVYNNVLFEFIIITFIASFASIDKMSELLRPQFSNPHVALLFILFLPLLVRVPYEIFLTRESIRSTPFIEKEIAEDVAFLSGYPDPIMCENLALSYWAGRKFTFDFYSTGQKLKIGSMKEDVLLKALQENKYSIVQINDEKGDTGLLPNQITRFIGHVYYPIRTSKVSGIFLKKNHD